MKSTFIIKPLEYSIEVIGERWRQGDKIKGSLKINNHSTEKIALDHCLISLCEGHYKKIKAKDKNGWKEVSVIKLDEKISLNETSEISFPFEFILSENCLITDKGGSLYLAFFENNEDLPVGHIELIVEPKLVISQVLEIFENFIRFKVAQMKSTKGMVEVKLNPPAGRDFSTIDSLVLNVSEIDKNLTMKYLFNTKVLDMSTGTMQAQKKVKEIDQVFNSKQYLIYEQSLNQDFIIQSINTVITEIKPKFM